MVANETIFEFGSCSSPSNSFSHDDQCVFQSDTVGNSESSEEQSPNSSRAASAEDKSGEEKDCTTQATQVKGTRPGKSNKLSDLASAGYRFAATDLPAKKSNSLSNSGSASRMLSTAGPNSGNDEASDPGKATEDESSNDDSDWDWNLDSVSDEQVESGYSSGEEPVSVSHVTVPLKPTNDSFETDKQESCGLAFDRAYNLAEILDSQESVLARKRAISGRSTLRNSRKRLRLEEEQAQPSETRNSLAKRWSHAITKISRGFFDSDEARMSLTNDGSSQSAGNKKPYLGLSLNEKNNADMRFVYNLNFKDKALNDGGTGTYDQFRTVVGQFARLAVALGQTELGTLYKEGTLLKLVTNMQLIQIFLNYFLMRSSSATVMCKAMHLKRLAVAASMFFGGCNTVMHSKADQATAKLRAAFNAAKSTTRSDAKSRQQIESRASQGKIFMRQDFISCRNKALSNMDAIIAYHDQRIQEDGPNGAKFSMSRNKKLVDKWCISFLVCLLMTSGQRPQAYCLLQAPSDDEIDQMRESCKRARYFQMRVAAEKIPRSVDLPNVIFPGSLLKYVEFHCAVARRAILASSGAILRHRAPTALLVHSKSGYELESSNVNATLKAFLKRHDPELTTVTPMTLRGSFATMMMKDYQAGRIFRGKSENDFLLFISKSMNTSPEQLRATYLTNDKMDYKVCARDLAAALETLDDYSAEREKQGNFADGAVCDFENGNAIFD